ncbi:MAG TPA: CaiB/BaiF CoA-transferase family protein, partial [Paracoccaceae bacterium]|nr:CaiB/BaiF CoA-transferase family protein [Paracoccaceae bacterium]
MGPLQGIRIVEMSGIGPAPFCGMLLADLGADVIRIDRLSSVDRGIEIDTRFDFLNRSKRAVAVDLKAEAGVALVKALVVSAGLLIEGFRPGVMERLGLGPDECRAVNPRLVYGRMTGWGQEGPLRNRAGHDINYIAMMGALSAIGPRIGPPSVPLNLVGDFGGGALYLAMGLLAALLEARVSGQGQVVDAAMVDGVASLMSMHFGYRQAGLWENARGSNAVDGGSPYYTTYATRDGKYMAVGAVEARFYAEMLARLGLCPEELPAQNDRARWGELRSRLAAVFATRTRDEWEEIFAESDACVSPVLDMDECVSHPLAETRGIFEHRDGVVEPAPAPRFSRTPGRIRSAPAEARADSR